MSNDVTLVCRPLQIPPTQKAVLMCLADYCRDTGEDWHSIPAIMEWTCLGKTAVIQALKALEAAGYVVRVHAKNGLRSSTFVQVGAIEAATHRNEAHQAASRTGPSGEPVRVANQTGPSGEPEPVRHAHQPVRHAHPKHQEASGKHQHTVRDMEERADHFPTFWSAYPRKVAKPNAEKAFARLRVDEQLMQAMLAAIERQRQTEQWRKPGGQYIPHPATWLNQRRWEDGEDATATADDIRPNWATRAGFTNRFDAENAGCFEHNAGSFHAGKRITAGNAQGVLA